MVNLLSCYLFLSYFFYQVQDIIRYEAVSGDMWCFFFFQAEDGIRDADVTGVQTCALPISRPAACTASASSVERDCSTVLMVTSVTRGRQCPRRWVGVWGAATLSGIGRTGERSEERRVGKEGISRWSSDQYKKKKRVESDGR